MSSPISDAADSGRPSAPLTVISDKDQTGVVVILTALGLVFAAVATLMRLYIRGGSSYQKDDTSSFASMGLGIVQAAMVFTSARWGLGKTPELIAHVNPNLWQMYLWIGNIFYLWTMCLTKGSVAFLYIRLSPNKNHNLASQLTILLAVTFAVAGTIAFGVADKCGTEYPGIGCSNRGITAWTVNTVFNILTEVALLGIAVYIVQGLQLPLRKKLFIMLAFAIRFPVIIPAILRLTYISTPGSDLVSSLAYVPVVACTQIELSFAIVTTTTACIKPFMSALNTHYGGPASIRTPGGTVEGSGRGGMSAKGTAGRGTELSNLSARSRASRLVGGGNKEKREGEGTTKTGGAGGNSGDGLGAQVSSGPPTLELEEITTIEERDSVGSSDSKKMIISKSTEWTVDFEESRLREIV